MLPDRAGKGVRGGRVNADELSFADLTAPPNCLLVLYLANAQDLRLHMSADASVPAGGIAYMGRRKAVALASPEPFSLMHELGHLLGVRHPEDSAPGAGHFRIETGPSISPNTAAWLKMRARRSDWEQWGNAKCLR